MIKKHTLINQIRTILILSMSISIILCMIVAIITSNFITNDQFNKICASNMIAFENIIETKKNDTFNTAKTLSENEKILDALRRGNNTEVNAIFQIAKLENNYECFVIDTHNEKVFNTSTNIPHFYENERIFIKAASGVTSAGLYSDNNKLYMVAASPIIYDNQLQGSMVITELINIESELDYLKDTTNGDFSIILNDMRYITTVVDEFGNKVINTKIDKEPYDTVMSGEEFIQNIELLGKPVKAEYKPLRDINNNIIGSLFTSTNRENVETAILFMEICSLVTAIVSIIISLFVTVYIINKQMIKPIKILKEMAVAAANGNLKEARKLEEQINYSTIKNEVGDLFAAQHESNINLNNIIYDLSNCLAALEKGNLAIKPKVQYLGEFLHIKNSLNKTTHNLSRTIENIIVSSQQVNAGASEIANGATQLAQSSTEQAGSVEILSSNIEKATESIGITNENAKSVGAITNDASRMVEISYNNMTELNQTMKRVSEKATEISKIIKLIEDIAFQTNILALNAAVEAARAGEAGKGFSVVADEVRNLAQKSAAAAKSTEQLIQDSEKAVSESFDKVIATKTDFEELAIAVKSIANQMQEVVTQTNEQSEAMIELSAEINGISYIVQSNSAFAQESAATAEELSAQANVLKELSDSFITETKNNINNKDNMIDVNKITDKNITIINSKYGV